MKERNKVSVTLSKSQDIFVSSFFPGTLKEGTPFPLTDIQEAYFTGRMMNNRGKDNIGTHIYYELVMENPDIAKLEISWKMVLETHEILRLKITPEGKQYIVPDFPKVLFPVYDNTNKTEEDTEAHKEALRIDPGHKVYKPGDWPLYDIRITLLPGNMGIVHLSVDGWLLDGYSLALILSHWKGFYDNPGFHVPLPGFSFGDMVIAGKEFRKTRCYRDHLKALISRLDLTGTGTGLPLNPEAVPAEGYSCFIRKSVSVKLPGNDWKALCLYAEENAISYTVMLFTLFTDFLASWSKDESFPVIITLLNRPPVHEDIMNVAGPFISTGIVHRIFDGSPSFLERNLLNNEKFNTLREHDGVNGVRVLRGLKNEKKVKRNFSIPLVFTSMLSRKFRTDSWKKQYQVIQTPQVYLEHIVESAGEDLELRWNFATPILAETDVAGAINSYLVFLKEKARELAVKEKKTRSYPLTALQKSYYVSRLAGFDSSALVYQEWTIPHYNNRRFEKALNKVITEEEAMRRILTDGKQCVQETVPFYRVTKEKFPGQFPDPGKWPLFHVCLAGKNGTSGVVGFGMDMLAGDIRCIYRIMARIMNYYHNPSSASEKRPSFFPGYIEEERKKKGDRGYWTEKFFSIPPGPFRSFSPEKKPGQCRRRMRIYWEGWKDLKELARAHELEPGLMLFSIFARHLYAECGEKDYSLIFVDWERSGEKDSGDFTTLSWIPVTRGAGIIEEAKGYAEIIRRDKSGGQFCGLETLSGILMKTGGTLRFPVVFTNVLSLDEPAPGKGYTQTPGVYLDFIPIEVPGGLWVCWDYDPAFFSSYNLKETFDSFCGKLNKDGHIASPEGARMKLTTTEFNKIVHQWNDTKKEFDSKKLMHHFFEEQASAFPDRIAAVFEEESITYGELNRKANQLAHHLISLGVEADTFVGICMDRSIGMLMGVLGILKAGGAYVPLVPSYPRDRIETIREIARLEYILFQEKHEALVDSGNVRLVNIDRLSYKKEDTENPRERSVSGNYAYAIFTSGSTGKPKGVAVVHRAVVNLIEWVNNTFHINADDRGLFITSLGFDLSVYDIFGLLGAGASLRIIPDKKLSDFDYVANVLSTDGITFWNSAPAALHLLIPFLKEREISNRNLRLVFLSGDWIPLSLPDEVRTLFKQARVISLGGATEATVWSNYYIIEEISPRWKSIPYGVPIQNARYYILDPELNPCPVGVEGELFIGGECLSQGYLNAPELTTDCFIPDPFVEDEGARMYRTGDLARFFPDGNIEFLGRKDFQVKIRGYRIELGEIEHALREHKDIRDVIVEVRESSPGDKKLVAYFIPRGSKVPANKELRLLAGEKLPGYMVPNYYIALESFPVTANGKTDRKRLPWPPAAREEEAEEAKPDWESFRGEIKKIFMDELGLPEMDESADIFDLGATSFNIVQVTRKIQKNMGIEIPVDVILDNPSIDGILRNLPAPLEKKEDGIRFSVEELSTYLDLFREYKDGDNTCCNYPPAGGDYPVQHYLLFSGHAPAGWDDGLYFYHPGENSLLLVKRTEELKHQDWREYKMPHGFIHFCIAHLETIRPVYGPRTLSLVMLNMGYITGMIEESRGIIQSRLLEKNDFENIGREILPADEYVILGAFGCFRKDSGNEDRSFADYKNGNYRIPPGFADICKHRKDAPRIHFFSKEERAVHAAKELRYKPLAPFQKSFPLPEKETAYKGIPVLSRFLSGAVTRENLENLLRHCSRAPDGPGITLQVNRELPGGMSPGVYKLNPDDGKLLIVSRGKPVMDKGTHYPFYRPVYDESVFCLYFTVNRNKMNTDSIEDFRYYSVLQAGKEAQRLMEAKSAYDIMLFPVGDMKYALAARHLSLEENEEIAHCLLGGFYSRNSPDAGMGSVSFLRNEGKKPGSRDIAIIGVSGQYAGADNPGRLWENLRAGINSSSAFPGDRWNIPADEKKRWGCFLDHIASFDSLLFHISPAEAATMDPQERLFLQSVWACLEDGGYHPLETGKSDRVGVFVGVTWSDYKHLGVLAREEGRLPEATAFHSSISNRVSHFFNFTGPSVAVDTSCSSALTALHMGLAGMHNDDCSMVIVGGVNIVAHPYHYELLESLGLLAADRYSRSFSSRGSGWVVGEGVGSLLLKPLDKAVRDGDWIYGVIKGTGIGHGGKTSRFWMPNTNAQAEFLEEVFRKADLSPGDISYIEAAAPGAGLTDASEMEALSRVFINKDKKIPVGSIKPNIGHLESASAIPQITKVLWQLRHKTIAPSLFSEPLNPLINLEDSPFIIPGKAMIWEKGTTPRRALVNAFGGTGTLAHVIIEEWTNSVSPGNAPEEEVFVLSAESKSQLRILAGELMNSLSFYSKENTVTPGDVAAVLQTSRVLMKKRLVFRAATFREASSKLSAFLGDAGAPGSYSTNLEGCSAAGPRVDEDIRKWLEEEEPALKVKKNFRKVPLPSYPFARVSHWYAGSEPPAAPVQAKQSSGLMEKTRDYILNLFADVSGIPVAKIETDIPLERYGINSMMIMKLNTELSENFEGIPKTLFFEYLNLEGIINFFMENHEECLVKMFGSPKPVSVLPEKKTTSGERPCVKSVVDREEIAVVGISGKYPGARDLEEFWMNLKNGSDSVSDIPPERWDYRRHFDPVRGRKDRIHRKWGGFIEDADKFDSLFFNISPQDADNIDPQERLFLETAWETMEDAGYSSEGLRSTHRGKVGVFAGVTYGEYQIYGVEETNRGGRIGIGSFYGSLANRVSYFLGLNGPSMAVDTMCSSSLTAVHLAVESLKRGECEAAFAGGVNLSLHPNKYLFLSQAGMLAADGRCRAFGNKGSGYVPGEGVGIVLLKPLSKAKEDHDHIYGVIKSTAVNHGGRTNGYYVPNPKAQEALVKSCLEKAGIDPGSISYVEAHGTGTHLGDPIEVRGLTAAFGIDAKRRQRCLLGSVKSNIGHLEAAAGIAGLTKILLQMKHKQIVPSLHAVELNENIDFSKTPFEVARELTSWKGGEVRRAGLSSFGAGGANGHLIIEEYVPPVPQGEEERENLLFVFSARDKTDLNRYLKKMISFLEPFTGETENHLSFMNILEILLDISSGILGIGKDEIDLDDDFDALGFDLFGKGKFLRQVNEHFRTSFVPEILIKNFSIGGMARLISDNPPPREASISPVALAYTLQAGRDSFAEKLAVIASDCASLVEKLKAREGGEKELAGVFEGRSGKVKREESLSLEDPVKLAKLWIEGVTPDWEELWKKREKQRLSLPTYPFRRERHWIQQTVPVSYGASLHPLVDENRSSFQGIRMRKNLGREEFFLDDHVIGTDHILPGVAFLEMALVAGEIGSGKKITEISKVTWRRPIIVNREKLAVSINLAKKGQDIVYSIAPEEDSNAFFGQGILSLLSDQGLSPASEDLAELQKRCTSSRESNWCYSTLKSFGLNLGESFKVIRELYYNDKEVFGVLDLPENLKDSAGEYTLHPSLLDGALQCAITGSYREGSCLYIPFSLERIKIFGKLNGPCRVYGEFLENRGKDIRRFNIKVFDPRGQILLQLDKFIAKPYDVSSAHKALPPGGEFFKPQWVEKMSESGNGVPGGRIILFEETEPSIPIRTHFSSIITVTPGERYRKLHEDRYEIHPGNKEDYRLLVEELEKKERRSFHIIHNWTIGLEAMEEKLDRGFFSLLFLSAALGEKRKEVRCLAVLPYKDPFFQALSGLVKTINKERPFFRFRLLSFCPGEEEGEAVLNEWNASWEEIKHIKVESRRRFEHTYGKVVPSRVKKNLSIKDKGLYLITGGTGGVGFIFARYLAAEKKATLLLVGRSPGTEETKKKLSLLNELGGNARYLSCDVSREDSVRRLGSLVKAEYGEVDGIIHAAGILDDCFFTSKNRESALKVLGPKVPGTIYLDQFIGAADFLFLCSSLAGDLGNQGQADYAYANSFLNEYAASKSGGNCQVFSLSWPFWKNGGMALTPGEVRRIERSMGIRPMEDAAGINAFNTALENDEKVLVYLEGKQGGEMLINRGRQAGNKKKTPASTGRREIQNEIFNVVHSLTGVPIDRIDPMEEIDAYGLDSIKLTDMINALNEKFDLRLTPAVFFELETSSIRALTEHINPLLKDDVPGEGDESPEPGLFFTQEDQPWVEPPDFPESVRESGEKDTGDIAVIGMAARFPGASHWREFWDNLINGNSPVGRIPPLRRKWNNGSAGDAGETRTYWGAFLEDVDKFDASFFGISRREAELMDPQQRIFLELVWQAIEDGGYKASSLSGSDVGLFVGVSTGEYGELLKEHNVPIDAYSATGRCHSITANRISYIFNFHGPSEPVDTACSSSLVAIDRAVKAIRSGQCRQALAGGVNVILKPDYYIAFSKAGMLSPGGKCKVFDESADGYVRSEGAGVVFLKPLSLALEDRDHIYAVIKSSCVNHGGRAKSLTAPNARAQADLLVKAYRQAGFNPCTVSMIEAHGTGTSLGDPVEINGIKMAFQELAPHGGGVPCAIGALKSQTGHMETAAGIGGVIKVILGMRKGMLPGNLNFNKLNPYIELEDTPFYILTGNKTWIPPLFEGSPVPRRAGVSSFGFGGANAHVVLEDYESPPMTGSRDQYLFLLSAKNVKVLKEYAGIWLEFLAEEEIPLEAVCYTLQQGRESMESRLAFIVKDKKELISLLTGFLDNRKDEACFYKEKIDRNNELKLVLDGNDGMIYVESLMRNERLEKLARLWTAGMEIDWTLLYGPEVPRKVSLPVYPFEKTSYWIPGQEMARENSGEVVLSGKEFFLRDHRIKDVKILPGVVHLDIIMGSVNQITQIEEVVWLQPVKPGNKSLTLKVDVDTVARHGLFRITDSGGDIVYSRGRFSTQPLTSQCKEVNLPDLKAHAVDIRRGEDVYDDIGKMGLNLGASFRVIEKLYYGDDWLLAELLLPPGTEKGFSGLYHPAILDGAMQTAIILGGYKELYIPFELKKAEIMAPLPSRAAVLVSGEKNGSYRMILCNREGKPLIRFTGMTPRKVISPGRNGKEALIESCMRRMKEGELFAEAAENEIMEILRGK